MLNSFRFHHLGMAVKSIEATASIYVKAGYSMSSVVHDQIQNVYICFLVKEGMPMLELVAPVDDTSPVYKTLIKNGIIPYHSCYIVDNLEDAIAELRTQKYVQVSKPAKAEALRSSRVCFMFHKNVGLIELAEAPATII